MGFGTEPQEKEDVRSVSGGKSQERFLRTTLETVLRGVHDSIETWTISETLKPNKEQADRYVQYLWSILEPVFQHIKRCVEQRLRDFTKDSEYIVYLGDYGKILFESVKKLDSAVSNIALSSFEQGKFLQHVIGLINGCYGIMSNLANWSPGGIQSRENPYVNFCHAVADFESELNKRIKQIRESSEGR